MENITPTLTQVKSFCVNGMKTRTKNMDECNPQTAKIPTLWQLYTAELPKLISDKINPTLYGVYSDYASDANDYYTLTVGITTKTKPVPLMDSVTICAGDYLIFTHQGEMPQAVIQLWQSIWSYFSEQPDYLRAYKTDFEVYRGADEVDIYIGVERS